MFGPIQDGMVLSKALLAPLVRTTAINANRAVRASKKEYKRPYVPSLTFFLPLNY